MSLLQDIVKIIYGLLGYERVTVSAYLNTVGGTPLPSQPITVQGGANSTAKTSSAGEVQFTVFLKPKAYTFKVSFAGASGYLASSTSREFSV